MSMSEEAAAGAERESPSHLSNQGMRKMLRCNYWEIRCQCPNIISFLLIFSKPNARPTTARPDINTISQEVNGSSQLLRKQITSLDLWILDRWHNKQHKHTLQVFPVPEIKADELLPVCTITSRSFGVPVSGKIHKLPVFIDQKVIDQLSFTGSLWCLGQSFFLNQHIDKRGFAHIWASYKCVLRQYRWR